VALLLGPDKSSNEFDLKEAELFEALGHPNRIEILQALNAGPLGFSELKKKIGIDSSGHLTFHLSKLDGLVNTNSEGKYCLTDRGKEALRVTRIAALVHVKEEGEEKDILAYDSGIKLGMEMRKALEENLRNYVTAGIIAVGCTLLLVLLRSDWFIVGLSAFTTYVIAYYSISRLFAKKDAKSIKHRRSLDVQYSGQYEE
jgi:DNA-binding transcriptional ArsR family regulator